VLRQQNAELHSHLDLVGLWLMWFGSAAAMAVYYCGPMVGAFALPSSIPGIGDLLIPLLMGIVEILLFTVLATLRNPVSALNAWLILVTLFAGLASIGTLVAMRHYSNGVAGEIYSAELAKYINAYKRILRRDAAEAPVPAVIAAFGAGLRIGHAAKLPVLTFPLVINVVLVLGLCGHELTARMSRRVLSGGATEEERRGGICSCQQTSRSTTLRRTLAMRSRNEFRR
jgi:hypothetical protein